MKWSASPAPAWAASPAAPFNQFSHARTLAGPADTFVTINNDTLYSIAQLDLSAGPLELSVPSTGERYFVLQFIDAWTNNFAYVGTRASGSDARSCLVTPPGWAGQVPSGFNRIPAPTQIVTILGRWACSGPDDLPVVHALQDQLSLRPVTGEKTGAGVPQPATVPDELEVLREAAHLDGGIPARGSRPRLPAAVQALGPAGRGSPLPRRTSRPDPRAGPRSGRGPSQAGSLHPLRHRPEDQRLDDGPAHVRLQPGLLRPRDDRRPAVEKSRPGRGLPERAFSARVGLWGNHAYEATYAQIFSDDQGEQLTGRPAATASPSANCPRYAPSGR